jgi:catechol 2,3-dioxygenase-like lactoylglutathione lyase family enzyme
MKRLATSLAVVVAAVCVAIDEASPFQAAKAERKGTLDLGNFSVSLAVKDLAASRAFYEKLGFQAIFGDASKNWLILRNGAGTIGLFQGMFEKNTLTFNPGWDTSGKPLEKFQDVREIQRALKALGLKPTVEADEASKGPAFLLLADPDGNPILLDQHVPRPGD